MTAKQVKFEDADGVIYGGILVNNDPDNAFIICGCCGSIYPMDEEGEEFKLIKVYDDWMNINEEITGE